MDDLVAREQFDAARFRAFRRGVRAVLTRGARRLASLDGVLEAAKLEARSDLGVQEIPLDAIVGSAARGRVEDFDPAFLPTNRHLRDRWARLHAAIAAGAELDPIDVYKVGDSYYVIDGHHRVSVLRSLGEKTIKARVVEVKTRAPVGSRMDAARLLKAAEYAAFLEATQLDRVRPEARMECSRLGRYDEILAHIVGHQYFMGLEQGRAVPIADAAASWYDTVYLPIAQAIRHHRVLDLLPGWTETDVYVEMTRRWLAMSQSGAGAGPHEAAHALLQEHTRRWWRRRRGFRLR
ncbi:MAG: hypothetical protein QOK05_1059 [Chloroflexota bacterium]|jgi:uncharacterized ParB-like nuclease family protein|nr:hypothetical protein [Chloroflexota bacterium]